MRRAAHLATLALLAVLGSSGSLATAAGATPVARTAAAGNVLGGINVTGVSPDQPLSAADKAIATAKALHVKVVRTDVPWSMFEPKGAGEVDPRAQAFSDRLVSDAAAAGIGVIMTVESSPCWASSAPRALLAKCHPGQDSRANSYPPVNAADYATFAAYLASRYGEKLAAIEVWNEPDQSNEDYFAGPNKPARYATVLRAAYPAIKQAAPGVSVLAGSLVGSNGAFLRALYAAGIKGFYDGLSVHFYNLTLGSLRSIHEVQLKAGDGTQLWLDEFGWTSCAPRRTEQEQACVTSAIQAKNLGDTFRAFESAPYLAAAVVYKLQDSRLEDFGVLSSKGARKRSFSALSRVLASPFGKISPVTLNLRRAGARVIASGSGPVGDFMQLEVFAGTVLRYRALFTLNSLNRFSIKLPAALGTSGLRVRVFQYWAGIGKAAQKST